MATNHNKMATLINTNTIDSHAMVVDENPTGYALWPLKDRVIQQVGLEGMIIGLINEKEYLIGPTPDCLSVNTAGDYVYGRLKSKSDQLEVAVHLLNCTECYQATEESIEWEIQREKELLPAYLRIAGHNIIEDIREGAPDLFTKFPLLRKYPERILT